MATLKFGRNGNEKYNFHDFTQHTMCGYHFKIIISYQIKYLFTRKLPSDYQYFKIMQWFRVEMAPVASSITVLDTQRQLIVLHF